MSCIATRFHVYCYSSFDGAFINNEMLVDCAEQQYGHTESEQQRSSLKIDTDKSTKQETEKT